MGPAEALSMMTFFVAVASVLILRGPLGKALAERVAGRPADADRQTAADLERLALQLDDVRHRLTEAEERLDFAERLLAKQKQPPMLPEG